MKKSTVFASMIALAAIVISPSAAQAQDRAAIEHELAITAYNYAVGCAERMKYEEALEGLTHIPAGQLNELQQSWADSLRMQCEAMVGHPMAAQEVDLTESERMAIDDQSETFLRGIRQYQAGNYAEARTTFTEVMDMGVGPREQVHIEAMFWRGQCQYQLKEWENCCNDLILFNDTKNKGTDTQCDVMAYYTMGYARMNQKKWRQARINFERYTNRQPVHTLSSYADGKSRLSECQKLENGSSSTYTTPLEAEKVEPIYGETIKILQSLMNVDVQVSKEQTEQEASYRIWKNWHAPYINM